MKNNSRLALNKTNFILIGIAFVVILLGFLLMVGAPSETEFNPDIFSTRRITIGPMISFFGFMFMIFAIMFKNKEKTGKRDIEK